MKMIPVRSVPETPGGSSGLVRRLCSFSYDSVPEDVRDCAKRLLVDTLAVSWAARNASGMEAVRRAIMAEGAAPRARLWGSGDRSSPGAAAFYNAAIASALDFDSVHEKVGVHADATIIPVAFAVGEHLRVDGRRFMEAFICGVELSYRLARATHTTAGWYRSAVYNNFGAAATACLLKGLDEGRLSDALGIALAQAAGTQQGHVEKKLTKRLLASFPARNGILAADLAEQGINGPQHPFDGKFGVFAMYDTGDPTGAFDDFCEVFMMPGVAIKKFPSCACSHAATEAALDIARSGLDADDIASVEVVITPYMDRLVGSDPAPDSDPEVIGQFSIRYAMAASFLRKRFSVADIEPAQVLDPAIDALAGRVRVTIDTKLETRFEPATVNVTTRDGQVLTRTVDQMPGGSQLPLSPAEACQKAVDAFQHGENGMSAGQVERLLERVRTIETVDDMSRFFDL